VYREALDDLPAEAWAHGAREAIRTERTTFLPAAGKLREYAGGFRPSALALPPGRRTPAELATDRAEARRGVELVRAALESRGVTLPASDNGTPVRTMVEADDDRLAILRAQAQRITDAA
jgi:hypothetical protein